MEHDGKFPPYIISCTSLYIFLFFKGSSVSLTLCVCAAVAEATGSSPNMLSFALVVTC